MILSKPNTETTGRTFTKGITNARATKSDEIIQQALKCLEQRIRYQTVAIGSPIEVRNYLRLQLATELNEIFAVMFLDNAHRVIAFEKVFQGTINAAAVYPRVVVQLALQHNAAAVIFAHNHPSGVVEPSKSDEYITTHLKSALELIDVRVLDHFIVSEESALSFAERGLL